jgi:hypothetical protein
MTNDIKQQARHDTAMFLLSALDGQEVVKVEADKKYALRHTISGETVWTEITITAKREDYSPYEGRKEK